MTRLEFNMAHNLDVYTIFDAMEKINMVSTTLKKISPLYREPPEMLEKSFFYKAIPYPYINSNSVIL